MISILAQSTALALDPNVHPSTYPRDRWGTDQGLSQSSITTINQTPDGFLWIGTESGLVRFDGLQFTVFDKSNTPELRVDFIETLLVGQDGSLWIGTRGSGLVHLDHGRFSAITVGEGLAENTVMELAQTRDGTIWIAALRGGLCRLRGGKVDQMPFGSSQASYSLVLSVDSDDRLWMGQEDGSLLVLEPGLAAAPSLRGYFSALPTCMAPDRDGRIWTTFNHHGGPFSMVASLHGGKPMPRLRGVLLPQESPTQMLFDRDGQGWLTFEDGGLMTFHDETVYRMSAAALDASISCFFEDKEGSVWAGAKGGGLIRFKNSRATGIGPAQGLFASSLDQVTEDVNGRLWVLSLEMGLQEINRDGPDGRMGGRLFDEMTMGIKGMTPSRDGGLWVCGAIGRLFRVPFGATPTTTLSNSVALTLDDITPTYGTIQSVFEMEDGAVWLMLRDGGVRRLDVHGTVTKFGLEDALPSMDIRTMLKARDGGFWLGTQEAGVCLWKPGLAKVFKGNENLDRVRSLMLDNRGVLWIGTRENGLFRLEGDTIKPCPIVASSTPKIINNLLEDGLGGLWIGGTGGIVTAARDEFDRAAATGIPVEATRLNEGDGMPGSECRGGYNSGAIRDRTGILWFATSRGLARVDPARFRREELKTPPIIQQFIVDGLQAPIDGPMRLDPGAGRVTIHYTLPSLKHPTRVRFATKLVGLETSWSRETEAREVNYAGLTPGNYEFRLKAFSGDRSVEPSETRLAFEIPPHFYQHRAVQAAFLLAIVGAVWTSIRVRGKQMRSRNEQLETLVRQRTAVLRQEVAERKKAEAALHQLPVRILEAQETERRRVAGELHDSVNQMLCAVKIRLQGLSRLGASDPKLGKLLRETTQVVQRTIDEVRFISRNLRPADLDDFGLLIALASLCREVELRTGIEVVWQPPASQPALDSNGELQVYRICQEALFNAEKHSGATRVVVSLSVGGQHLILSIRDNGEGIQTAGGRPLLRSTGLGLPNLTERARSLGAEPFFDGVPGQGLEIRIHIPHAKAPPNPQVQRSEEPETAIDPDLARR